MNNIILRSKFNKILPNIHTLFESLLLLEFVVMNRSKFNELIFQP